MISGGRVDIGVGDRCECVLEDESLRSCCRIIMCVCMCVYACVSQ